MALVDAHIGLILRFQALGQRCQSEMMYFTEGAVFVGVNAVQVANAWWNDMSPFIRALALPDLTEARFESVICRNLVAGGELGEYAIPSGEQAGTRDTGTGGTLPPFVNSGIRLSVGNTTTRPGQKRFPFLLEGDVTGNALVGDILDILDTLGSAYDTPRTLGSPVALGVLQPVIGGTFVDGFPTVFQDVVGHVVNPYATSQVSRKQGHGS
jgi:hypothetical protein